MLLGTMERKGDEKKVMENQHKIDKKLKPKVNEKNFREHLQRRSGFSTQSSSIFSVDFLVLRKITHGPPLRCQEWLKK